MSIAIPSDIPIDRENAFLLYATFCGDVERTAHALNVRAVDVLRIADDEGWQTRLGPILALKKSTRPGDIERAINRALNFVQAHRMRMFLEKIIHKITGLGEEQIEEYLFTSTPDKNGDTYKKLTTRALADLTSALEKCHALTYLALNDTVQDRTRRKEQTEGDESAGELNVQIAKAMAEKRASSSPRGQLFEAQLEVANRSQRETEAVVHPNDNDDH